MERVVAANSAGLEPVALELARGANYAAFTTLMPDGSPQTHLTWVGEEGGDLLVNTQTHHQKYRNVLRDPRVAVTVWDQDNPYRYAEVRGEVVEAVGGAEAREHIDELSLKYHGALYGRRIESERVSERVILHVRPHRQVINAPGFGQRGARDAAESG